MEREGKVAFTLAKKLYNEWGEVQEGPCGPPPPLHEDPRDNGVPPGWRPMPGNSSELNPILNR